LSTIHCVINICDADSDTVLWAGVLLKVQKNKKRMRKEIREEIISWSLIGSVYLWQDEPRKQNLKLQVINVDTKLKKSKALHPV
jgi:hypothetical protein